MLDRCKLFSFIALCAFALVGVKNTDAQQYAPSSEIELMERQIQQSEWQIRELEAHYARTRGVPVPGQRQQTSVPPRPVDPTAHKYTASGMMNGQPQPIRPEGPRPLPTPQNVTPSFGYDPTLGVSGFGHSVPLQAQLDAGLVVTPPSLQQVGHAELTGSDPSVGVAGVGHSQPVPTHPLAFIPGTSPGFDTNGRPVFTNSGPGLVWPPQVDPLTAPSSAVAPNYQVASEYVTDENDGMSVGDLAAEFEKRWAEQKEINDDLRSRISKSVQPGTKLGTMKIVGRVHADHWAFPGESPGVNAFERLDSRRGPQDRFLFRRMRFGVRGDVWENMDYRIEMEFGGGDDSQFRDAWLSFKHLPFLQTLRIGNQKRPYGLDHLNSSRYNVFIERPFIVEAFNQDSRRIGIQSWAVSEDQAYNWRFGVFNQRLIQDEGSFISDHYQAEAAGRFAHTWWYDESSDGRGYGHWAIAGSVAHPDGSTTVPGLDVGPDINEARFRTRPEARSSLRWLNTGFIDGADWYQLLALEAAFNVGPFQFVGEHMNVFLQRDTGAGPDLYFHGGYAYISYFLTGEHIPWERKSGTLGRVKPFENFFLVNRCCGDTGGGWGAWQVAVRWSYGDLSDNDILGGVGESLTFGLNWHWNDNARMQFNYIYGDVSERSLTDVNGLTFTGGDYHIIGSRFMIDF